MKEVKATIAQELEETLEINVNIHEIETPSAEHGDFAYPCMKAASQRKDVDNPRKLAEETREKLEDLDLIQKIEVAGPGYLNFHLDKEKYTEKIHRTLKQEKMGVQQKEGSVLVEFSSPNVAKPMHIGHFRNNALGDSIQRIMAFNGYDVTSENYIGDWGSQYGKLIHAYKKYGSEEEFEENPMAHMYELYVRFHDEAEDNEEMIEKGREYAKKVEDGDEEAKKLWTMFRDESITYHKKDYQRMGIDFDRWTGESKVVEEAKELVAQWLEDGKLERDSDGSVFMEFEKEENMPGAVIQKSDGSTLYITRDLANLKKRNEEGFDYNFYVVGSEQDLNFQQLFKAGEKLGIDTEGSEHISYGMLSLTDGSMSSRKGNIIKLSEVLDKAVEEAEKRIEERDGNPEAVGIGAVKYANLSVTRPKDITFDWDQVLSFEGDSGPYIQYSNTRAKSILNNFEKNYSYKGNLEDLEYRLVKKLGEFPEVVENSGAKREPAKIANYLSTVCEEFNKFYHECPVNNAEEETSKRRAAIVKDFIKVTDQGMKLLGIEPLKTM